MTIQGFNPPPPGAINIKSFQDLRQFLLTYVVNQWMQYTTNYFNSNLLPALNMSQHGYAPDIASAATITPSALVQTVTGTVAISTIVPPLNPQNLAGPIHLFSQDGFSTQTSGNILQAVNVPAGHMAIFTYHPAKGKWGVVTS